MDVVVWRGDVVGQGVYRIGPGERDDLCAVALVVGRRDGRYRIGQGGDIRMGCGRSRKLGGSVGVGYEPTDDLHDGFSEGTVEDVDGGSGEGLLVLSEVFAMYSVAIFGHGEVHVLAFSKLAITSEFFGVIRPCLHSTKTHCRRSALPISRLELNMDPQQQHSRLPPKTVVPFGVDSALIPPFTSTLVHPLAPSPNPAQSCSRQTDAHTDHRTPAAPPSPKPHTGTSLSDGRYDGTGGADACSSHPTFNNNNAPQGPRPATRGSATDQPPNDDSTLLTAR